MVGGTRFELVTPTMSTLSIELYGAIFPNENKDS